MGEMDFLSCGNRFLLFNFFSMGAVTEIDGPFFWGKTLFPLVERDFLSSGNCFLLFQASFMQVETVRETS